MTEDMYDISIVIPTYNRVNLLLECLDSVFAIERYRAEIIVIDDASTDGTAEVVFSITNVPNRHRLQLLRNSENTGAQVSRNRGLGEAKAPVVQFLDSDDVLISRGVEQALEALTRSQDLDYVYGKVQKCDSNLDPICEPLTGGEYTDDPAEIAGYHWHTMGALYRAAFLRESVGRWNEELSGSQDWEYQARVKLASSRRKFIPVKIGLWRQHDASRVSVTAYNSKYVHSVRLAVLSIAAHAANAGVTDCALINRLWKRLALHAIEAGAHADTLQRDALLRAAHDLPCARSLSQTLLKFLIGHAPTPLSATLFRIVPWIHGASKVYHSTVPIVRGQ
jgi:glycosyltransferase involved in cell wall biosynthesis